MKTTGRSYSGDWVMLFTVRDGQVTEFREFGDPVAVNAAF